MSWNEVKERFCLLLGNSYTAGLIKWPVILFNPKKFSLAAAEMITMEPMNWQMDAF